MTICPNCGHHLTKSLTPKERHIAALAADGFGITAIAEETGTTVQTAKNQMAKLYRKLAVPRYEYVSRIKLAVWWNCELFQVGLKELGLVNRAA